MAELDLVLEMLRRMQVDMREIKEDMREILRRVSHLEQMMAIKIGRRTEETTRHDSTLQ